MQRLRVSFYLPGRVTIPVQEGEEQTATDLMDLLAGGSPPAWLEGKIREALEDTSMEHLEIEHYEILGTAPEPDEELDFDN